MPANEFGLRLHLAKGYSKVLPREMDPDEIRLILKVFIKGRDAEIFSEFRQPRNP
jgi:hypothetical protein